LPRSSDQFDSGIPLHNFFIKEKNMGDPRSKAKAPKLKENKAPHQQILQKQQAMKAAGPSAPVQKVMRNTGRGR
jgi:hypothetical protein